MSIMSKRINFAIFLSLASLMSIQVSEAKFEVYCPKANKLQQQKVGKKFKIFGTTTAEGKSFELSVKEPKEIDLRDTIIIGAVDRANRFTCVYMTGNQDFLPLAPDPVDFRCNILKTGPDYIICD